MMYHLYTLNILLVSALVILSQPRIYEENIRLSERLCDVCKECYRNISELDWRIVACLGGKQFHLFFYVIYYMSMAFNEDKRGI